MFDYLLYYPITFILWVWHKVFGFVFSETAAISWVLGLVFLTFTIRAILFKPFVGQVRSMKKMQDFAPEIKKIQKRYANDRQRQAQAMQKLQREHGFNPLGGCLPILVQIPVFIGLNHVLRAFAFHAENDMRNYFFSIEGTKQYIDADLFGSHLGQAIYNTGFTAGEELAGYHPQALPVAVPLMVLASILTHLTARHSVARQNPAAATQQTAIMNKMTLYIFPIGLLAFGAFLPLGLLVYFLANNGWTLMQQRIVYTRIDKEEEEKKQAKLAKKSSLAPKPGQKPQAKTRPDTQSSRGSKQADKSDAEKPAEQKKPAQADAVPDNGKDKPATSAGQEPQRNGSPTQAQGKKSAKKKSGKKPR